MRFLKFQEGGYQLYAKSEELKVCGGGRCGAWLFALRREEGLQSGANCGGEMSLGGMSINEWKLRNWVCGSERRGYKEVQEMGEGSIR